MNHFAIRSQQVVTPNGIQPATVIIHHGLIQAVTEYTTSVECPIEDLGQLVLMPGLVDTHVHINEPGRTDWEGFNTATQAAAAGGITTLVDMPLNCIPVTTTETAFNEKLHAIKNKLWVDCGFWGGVVPSNIEDLEALLAAGVLGVKSFLIDSGIEEFPPVSAADMRKAIPILAKYHVPYLIHAELDLHKELDQHNQPPPTIGNSYQSFLASRPKHWENEAINLLVQLCADAKAKGLNSRIHIVHLSSAEALPTIAQARRDGLDITAETCPHYLTLDAESIPDGKTLFKCCPPIREHGNQQLLWDGLKAGLIDFIVSDHSPCTPQLKHIDSGDLEQAWGGISALQFGLPLIWSAANKQGFTLVDIAHWMASAPADFIGLGHTKGRIAPGYQADLFVFDPAVHYPITQKLIKHRHKITPYAGKRVTGEVLTTYLRGEIIYAKNKDNNGLFINGPFGRPLLKENE
ncbi:allantoinase AllB [Endozoicomonas sp. SM1973]|uniref:allantoinase n=1 Tax=Spartinivicinus marinus TaxID=2994442 RepID=A0A853ICJ9_9GAMM|nr:allantoinase AllB [Spartinivicinus marinus]MCX4029522.1 allantoinase AllB [Spartinivicinus marinus]NYZ65096.1 allantoinase AllB [Spartinivicinus marinus]